VISTSIISGPKPSRNWNIHELDYVYTHTVSPTSTYVHPLNKLGPTLYHTNCAGIAKLSVLA